MMKSYLFLIVFAAVLVCNVQAQVGSTLPLGSVEVSRLGNGNINVKANMAEAYKVVKAIAAATGYELIFRDLPKEPISIDISDTDPDVVLSAFLNEEGYRYEKKTDDKTITIYLQNRVVENPPPHATKTVTTAANPSYDEYIQGELSRVRNQAAAFMAANTWNGSYYGYGYGYGPLEAEAWRQFVNRGQEAGLRTTGDVAGVSLYSDNCYIGDADQFSRWWNQQSAQRSGQMVKITARRIKDNKAYDQWMHFPSVAEAQSAGMNHFTLGIHNEDFDRGQNFDPDVMKSCR